MRGPTGRARPRAPTPLFTSKVRCGCDEVGDCDHSCSHVVCRLNHTRPNHPRRNHTYHTLRRAAALALAFKAPAVGARPRHPPASKDESVVELRPFTVIGSNIRRLDTEKVLPVTVFDAAADRVRDPAQPRIC